MRSINSSGVGYGLFLRARGGGGVGNRPPRKTKNCKSRGYARGVLLPVKLNHA